MPGGSKANPQGTTAHRATFAAEEVEVVPSTQSANQADSRARPFWRRAEMMARPARVCIRFRKPCFLARRRVLGWYVRFMSGLLLASVDVVRKGSARNAVENDGIDSTVDQTGPMGRDGSRTGRVSRP